MSDNIEIRPSSGNVFADLGIPDADTHLAKAKLITAIAASMKKACLTQSDAAERMGISQPDLSKILNGRVRAVSMERLLGYLTALGNEVMISVKLPVAKSKAAGRGRLIVRTPTKEVA